MTEHDRETWQQNDYDPKFIETDEGLRIARAFEEVGAEQIVAEHNALGELLEAAKALLGACYSADMREELPYEIDGSYLDAMRQAIDKAQRTEERR